MSNSTNGGIGDVGLVVRCCLSVNSSNEWIGDVGFVVICCFSVKFDEWRDWGVKYWCKMLFQCQIRKNGWIVGISFCVRCCLSVKFHK